MRKIKKKYNEIIILSTNIQQVVSFNISRKSLLLNISSEEPHPFKTQTIMDFQINHELLWLSLKKIAK